MQVKKWILTGVIIAALFFAGFIMKEQYLQKDNVVESDELQQLIVSKQHALAEYENSKLAEAYAIEKEAEEKAAEALALKEAEEIRLEDIRKNTYFAKQGAIVYASPSLEAAVAMTLDYKSSVYATQVVTDAENKPSFYQIKSSPDEGEMLGYVPVNAVVNQRADFISNPISDVDYTAFEKKAKKVDIAVKAIFVTGHTASGARMDELIALIDETELNAVVIDVKDDMGYMLFPTQAAEKFNKAANTHAYLEDVKPLIEKLKAHDIYVIARIVTFKSPLYAQEFPDRAIVFQDGGKLYSDSDRLLWASPHDRILWDYNVSVAEEAAALGFDEIQFDYVRFPAIYNQDAMNYRNTTGESQTAAIQNFLKYAYDRLANENVVISADVFGWAASATDDVGIGQHWEAISNVVDVMCPMMYPSHYGPGNFGLSVPDAFPYETIDRSIKAAMNRNANLETPATMRPWIQDFTATWVKGYIRYGAKEVKAQIDALKDNGIDEYLVWNAGNYYSKEAFK